MQESNKIEEITSSNKYNLAEKAFLKFKEEVLNLLSLKKTVFVALCGGSSVTEFYDILGNRFEELPYDRLHFFMLDERINESQRNSLLIKEKILSKFNDDKLNLFRGNFHFLGKKSVEEYTLEFKDLNSNLYFDIVVASSGEDCHIASLFPKSQLLKSKETSYAYVDDSPKPPKERITLLPESIKHSKISFIFFLGEHKRKAYEKFIQKDYDFFDCPVKMLKQTRCYLVTNII